jgi:hypothetical protein
VNFYVNVILITMQQTLCFRRKVQNHGGYYFVSVPPAVAQFLNCKEVDIVILNGAIVMKRLIMKRQKVKSNKTNKNVRNVKIHCIDCGRILKFIIENGVIVESDGVIACNIPGAICHDCIESVLEKVADPPGLICIKNLDPILAREIIMNFNFLLPPSNAIDLFRSMFPDNDLVYAACEQRLHCDRK